jgi:hypothetical protein
LDENLDTPTINEPGTTTGASTETDTSTALPRPCLLAIVSQPGLLLAARKLEAEGISMFGFIGRKQRMLEARQRLQAVRNDDVSVQIEAIAPLQAKDRAIYEMARKLIEAKNVDRVFKLFEAGGA